jgi:hypothetical protein
MRAESASWSCIPHLCSRYLAPPLRLFNLAAAPSTPRSSDAASARACPTLLVALGLSSCSVRALASTSYCRHGRRLEGRGSMLPCPPSRWLSSGTLTEQCAVWGSNSSEDWRAGCMRSRSCPTSPVIASSLVERVMGADGCKRDEALRGLRGLRGLVREVAPHAAPQSSQAVWRE